jgi:hypothetical protein
MATGNTLINKIIKTSGTAAKSFLGLSNTNIFPVSHSNYRSGGEAFGNKGWIFGNGNEYDKWYDYEGLDSVMTAYEQCGPIYSIINKQMMTFLNGKTKIVSKSGKEATTDFAKKVKALLANPNPETDQKEFEAQIAIYTLLFKYCIIYPVKPSGFGLEDATALWVIPPYMCSFVYAKETFFNLKKGHIASIKIRYGNEETILNPEDVIIIKGAGISRSSMYVPDNAIKPIKQNINNICGIYESKGTLINHRGSLGILTPEIDPAGAIAQDPEEQKRLHADYNLYGLKTGQKRIIIANSAMKWQSMSVPYRDLMFTEWAEDDIRVICDTLNYPYKLLANQASSSMNGTETDAYKKQLYQDFTIPFSELIMEQIGSAFGMQDRSETIIKDFSHVSILQEDDVKKATALLIQNQGLKMQYEAGIITLDEWAIATGGEALPDGAGSVRSTDIKNTNVPLASIIGVGGVQSLISILTASGVSEEARSASLQILFGISPENAALMTAGNEFQTATSVA